MTDDRVGSIKSIDGSEEENEGPPTCTKCNGDDHVAKNCRATWRKAWPGRWVMRLGLRTPEGITMELTIVLGEAMSKQALTLWHSSIEDEEGRKAAHEFKNWPEPTKKDSVG